MTAVDFVTRAIAALERFEVPYVTVGSFAVNATIEPRLTKDADFVVQLEEFDIGGIVKTLGEDFIFAPQRSFESITLTPRFKVRHKTALFSIEFFCLKDDSFDQARFARRVHGGVAGVQAFILTPEDIIVTKLQWAVRGRRAKDCGDIENVLAVHFSRLDLAYIRQRTDQHGTRELFEKLFAEAERFNAGQA